LEWRLSQRYELPSFLEGIVSRESYVRWLSRKAQAHARRDRKRGNINAAIESYKREIHRAVLASDGKDQYTGLRLDWSLISQYKNDESKQGRRVYKTRFALLPTVDHVGDGLGEPSFKICSWRVNDAKSDLSHDEFVELCRQVVDHYQLA
jgi:hypothetical protein